MKSGPDTNKKNQVQDGQKTKQNRAPPGKDTKEIQKSSEMKEQKRKKGNTDTEEKPGNMAKKQKHVVIESNRPMLDQVDPNKYKPGDFRVLKKAWIENERKTLENTLPGENKKDRNKRLERLWFESEARRQAISSLTPQERARRRFNLAPK